MKTSKLFTIIMLAILGLSLVAAQEDEELQPGLAMYLSSVTISVRAEASTSAENLAQIEPGTVLTINEIREDGWVHVTYGDISGWLRRPRLVNVTEDELIDPDDPLPPPTGPYKVGQIYLHWVDESREEVHTEEEGDFRELMVLIWYPAEAPEDAESAPYWQLIAGPLGDLLVTAYPDNPLTPLRDKLVALRSHAYHDVALSNEQSTYPVLIFSHGHGGWPELYTLQALELASHGYIVVGIDHAYYSVATQFPDGDFAYLVGITNESGRLEADATAAQDIIFTIDQLENLNADDPEGILTGKIDLERVGVFGHSMGGQAAVRAAFMDDRILAVINEDGYWIDRYTYPRAEQPLMFFSAGMIQFPSAGINYTVRVNDFDHGSFADTIIFIPGVGSVIPSRSVEIVRSYVLAFFDEYLKGIEQPLLDGPSDEFPEVEFTINNPG